MSEYDNELRQTNELKIEVGAMKAQLLDLQSVLFREGIAKQHLTEENGSLTKQLEQVILENNKKSNV